jgi:hypothetical protein
VEQEMSVNERWRILLFQQELFGEAHKPANFAHGAAPLLKLGSGRKFFLGRVKLLPEFDKGQCHSDILPQSWTRT